MAMKGRGAPSESALGPAQPGSDPVSDIDSILV